MKDFDRHMQNAKDLLAAGFTSKAAQTRANAQVTYALDAVNTEIRNIILACRAPGSNEMARPEHHGIYWNLPMYPHQIKAEPTISAIYKHLPEAAGVAESLRAVWSLHCQVKSAPIAAKPAVTPYSKTAVETMHMPLIHAEFKHTKTRLIVMMPNGQRCTRCTTHPYKYVAIATKSNGDMIIVTASTVSLEQLRTQAAHHQRFWGKPLTLVIAK